MPQPRPDAPEQSVRSAARARWSVAACGTVIGATPLHPEPRPEPALPKRLARWRRRWARARHRRRGTASHRPGKASDAATPQELMQNWPRFRGPGGGGVSPSDECARGLGREDRRGHCLEGAGARPAVSTHRSSGATASSSPAATRQARGLLPGRQDRPDPLAPAGGQRARRPAQPAEVPETTGYAASTMATDGRRVYVVFANGDCAAFTFEASRSGPRALARSRIPMATPPRWRPGATG